MKLRKYAGVAAVCAAALGLVLRPAGARAEEWRAVGGPLKNISGMALVENAAGRTVLLVVHDNKRETEGRAGLVTLGPDGGPAAYTPLPWPKDGAGGLPIDLEAVSAVPGAPGEYVALTSDGTAFHVRVDAAKASLSVVRSFKLPTGPEGSNYEGFALFRPSEQTSVYAVWGHRGASAQPSRLHWARFETLGAAATPGPPSLTGTAELSVPWPVADVRHVSDLKVDAAGNLFVSSAGDPGDEGPFASALYLVGSFAVVPYLGGAAPTPATLSVEFRKNPALVSLRRFRGHKVEAFDLVPGAEGGVMFGTDDEALGTWVLRD